MSLLVKRPHVDHPATAARLRTCAGVWQAVGEYRSTSSSEGIVRYIRSGRQRQSHRSPSPYAPAGAFEARSSLTEFGVLVEARYVGGGAA